MTEWLSRPIVSMALVALCFLIVGVRLFWVMFYQKREIAEDKVKE